MESNSKTDRRRLLNLSMRVVVALVMVGLLVIPIAVQADPTATAPLNAWDFVAGVFHNGNVIIPWNGTWVPFLHELTFDEDLSHDPPGCSAGESSRWAGFMYLSLHHEDNLPPGAPGFQESQNLSLISCDRNGDGYWDAADLTEPPSPYDRPVVYAECDTANTVCNMGAGAQDVVVPCTTPYCESEINTLFRVNLDQNCDGIVDPELGIPTDSGGHPEMLCFYAEARTPTLEEQAGLPPWSNPLQAYIAAVSSKQIVEFNMVPTAIDLASFDAAPQGNGVLLTWETATETDNVGFNVYRAETQSGQLIKINPYLIAAQNPGSTAGAAYSFLDESAVPGATYYYWLEDIDAAGVATMQGPAVAKMDAAKALPGRPRPAPMPENAF